MAPPGNQEDCSEGASPHRARGRRMCARPPCTGHVHSLVHTRAPCARLWRPPRTALGRPGALRPGAGGWRRPERRAAAAPAPAPRPALSRRPSGCPAADWHSPPAYVWRGKLPPRERGSEGWGRRGVAAL
ncbi:Magnesium Transporter Nipa4 [Manis pentadactyla]|nr:Magnesium Transporter Nipa4 [Manis pentadactyla]